MGYIFIYMYVSLNEKKKIGRRPRHHVGLCENRERRRRPIPPGYLTAVYRGSGSFPDRKLKSFHFFFFFVEMRFCHRLYAKRFSRHTINRTSSAAAAVATTTTRTRVKFIVQKKKHHVDDIYICVKIHKYIGMDVL